MCTHQFSLIEYCGLFSLKKTCKEPGGGEYTGTPGPLMGVYARMGFHSKILPALGHIPGCFH